MRIHNLLVFLIATLPLAAQPMSGAYTIDNALPTGGGNYATFVEAAQDLMARGVGGPVDFNVARGSGPYGGFHLGPFAGASANNRVTFRGVGRPLIQGTYTVVTAGPVYNHTVNLYPLSYNGLGSNYLLGTGPAYVTLEGLEITNGTGAGNGAVVAAGCESLVIRSCTIRDSDAAVSVAFSPRTTLEDCDIRGISPPVLPNFPGRWSAVVVAATCDYSIIRGNRIHDCAHAGLYAGGQFYPSTGVSFSPSHSMLVANNMIWNVTGRASLGFGAVNIYGAPGAVVSHNTIFVPAGGVSDGLRMGTTSAPAEVSNNLIKHDGTHACIALRDGLAAVPLDLDDNLYDPGPTASVGNRGGLYYPTLAAWQAAPGLAGKELNSFVAPAGLVSSTDLHVTHTSAAINMGTAVVNVPFDIDGNPRDASAPCIGADEFVLTLGVTQPMGPGTDVYITNHSLIPGREYYNGYSFALCPTGPGGGPYLGLCAPTPADVQFLVAQLNAQMNSGPFHFNANDTTIEFGPYNLPPLTVDAVCFDFTGGIIGAVSEVQRVTIL